MNSLRFWFVLTCDVSRPIGGVKQIHRLAECINALGFSATIIQETADFKHTWFTSTVDTISLPDFLKRTDLSPSIDILILPETFVHLIPRFLPGFKKIIFNQNVSYTFGLNSSTDGMPKDPKDLLALYFHPDVLKIWCVSQSDYMALLNGFNFSPNIVSRIVNSIESDLFYCSFPKTYQIAYMPRKNTLHCRRALALFDQHEFKFDWTFKPLHNLPLHHVASCMRSSAIFLSFGHPEGFGLPLAEALASGCAIIGYDGIGGSELFDLALSFKLGWKIDFGDISSFPGALHAFENLICDFNYDYFNAANQVSSQLLSRYSSEVMISSANSAIATINSPLC